jgi:uncharacterized protein YacL
MNDTPSHRQGWQANIRRQTLRLGYWTLGWLVTMAIANFGPKFFWNSNELMTIAAIGLNLLIGIGMIVANKDHLRSLDEMHQKIQLEAMGLTLGIGLVVGLAYSNLDIANIVSFDAEIAHVVILMSLTYLATLITLTRKMR